MLGLLSSNLALGLRADPRMGGQVANPPARREPTPDLGANGEAWRPAQTDFGMPSKASQQDVAHIFPYPMTLDYYPATVRDRAQRQFGPEPSQGQRERVLTNQILAPAEERLRGPFGTGGKKTDWQAGGLYGVNSFNDGFKPIEYGKPGEPFGDTYEQAHKSDYAQRSAPLGVGMSTLNRYLAAGGMGDMGRQLTPDMPHVHPSVQPLAPRPGDYEKSGGADYLTKPPEILPPQPPYLYPPHRPGEFAYAVPPERANEYGPASPAAYPEPPPTCVPAKDVPFLRSLPAAALGEYCVPLKYLPFYHPASYRMGDHPRTPEGAAGSGAPPADSPFFVAPPTPSPQFQAPLPFSSAPKFMPYRELGMGGPPPGPVPPPPANYPLGSLANKPPPLPPPPMPPPMMPYG